MAVLQHEREQKSAALLELLKSKLASHIISSRITLGDAEVHIRREGMLDFFGLLKLDSELRFEMLMSVTAVDWLDEREDRFEVVYHLLSLTHLHRLRIKIAASETEPVVESVVSLWESANFLERECHDMYGIRFNGNPDHRRILMYEEFEGYPLRKDYPVQGKQPRVKLRYPEVENTARHMIRPTLVQIGKGRNGAQHS
ncbi:MAG: NADH-quinone oxidoreductase subunit C [Bdellovibrionales bacterium]|nr:NADH-quinone oxidoreductase subunit C [Bdellovibrionales bacterium]